MTRVDDEFATDRIPLRAMHVLLVCGIGRAKGEFSACRFKFRQVVLDDRGQADCDRSVFVVKGTRRFLRSARVSVRHLPGPGPDDGEVGK